MRERKAFTRPSGKRSARLVIIATEGAKTEKTYFEGLVSPDGYPNSGVHVEVLSTKDGKSSPQQVIKRLNAFKRTYHLDKDDQLWLVIDRDLWKEKNLAEIAQHCHQKKYHLGLSNPCFELWLLLHWKDPATCSEEELQNWKENAKINSKRTFLEEALKQATGGYNKSNSKFISYYPLVQVAIQRGRALDQLPASRWPEYLASRIYLLVEELIPAEPSADPGNS